MLRMLRKRIHSEKGFTLIELLVVILIIGILAAIALPAFLNQRQKGQDAESKAATRTAATAMETCSTENNGNYSTCNAARVKVIEPSLNNATGLTAVGTADGYTVKTDSKSGRVFTLVRASDGTITRTCSGTPTCDSTSW